jgi:hypothetical protein
MRRITKNSARRGNAQRGRFLPDSFDFARHDTGVNVCVSWSWSSTQRRAAQSGEPWADRGEPMPAAHVSRLRLTVMCRLTSPRLTLCPSVRHYCPELLRANSLRAEIPGFRPGDPENMDARNSIIPKRRTKPDNEFEFTGKPKWGSGGRGFKSRRPDLRN